MKKIILSLLILLSALVVPFYAQQKQRLGIKPQKINLEGEANTSAKIEAYCFDRHIVIDKAYDYNYLHTDKNAVRVTVGDKEYSLPEAISAGKIRVTGRPGNKGESDLIIEITKLTAEKVTVNVEKVSVFRNMPGTYDNRNALNRLSAADSSQSRQDLQDSIWESDIDRMRLESLGFKSIAEFQKKFGLSDSNAFDAQTSALLAEKERALIRFFEQNYLSFPRTDTKVKSVADNIERLEEIYELEQTGVYSPLIATLFESYRKEHLPKIRELRTFSAELKSYVFRIEPSYGVKNSYTFYSPLGAFKLKNTKEVTDTLSAWSERFEEIYVSLEGFSPEQAEGLKTSLNIHSVNMLRNDSTKGKFFLTGEVTQFVSSSPVVKIGSEYRSTLVYKTVKVETNQKMNVTARLRQTVSKFIQSFKSLATQKRSLPSIVSEARKASGSVKLGFGEFGEIEIIELLREKSFELNAE
jgi:hypothetical protein